jgi:hypothetical protein
VRRRGSRQFHFQSLQGTRPPLLGGKLAQFLLPHEGRVHGSLFRVDGERAGWQRAEVGVVGLIPGEHGEVAADFNLWVTESGSIVIQAAALIKHGMGSEKTYMVEVEINSKTSKDKVREVKSISDRLLPSGGTYTQLLRR